METIGRCLSVHALEFCSPAEEIWFRVSGCNGLGLGWSSSMFLGV